MAKRRSTRRSTCSGFRLTILFILSVINTTTSYIPAPRLKHARTRRGDLAFGRVSSRNKIGNSSPKSSRRLRTAPNARRARPSTSPFASAASPAARDTSPPPSASRRSIRRYSTARTSDRCVAPLPFRDPTDGPTTRCNSRSRLATPNS